MYVCLCALPNRIYRVCGQALNTNAYTLYKKLLPPLSVCISIHLFRTRSYSLYLSLSLSLSLSPSPSPPPSPSPSFWRLAPWMCTHTQMPFKITILVANVISSFDLAHYIFMPNHRFFNTSCPLWAIICCVFCCCCGVHVCVRASHAKGCAMITDLLARALKLCAESCNSHEI